MATGKKSFILYCDQRGIFDKLSDEQAGALIKHIFAYVSDENPESDFVTELAFEGIKNTLKRDLKKWESQQEQRSEAGRRSAEVRKRNAEIVKRKSTTVNDRSISSTVSVSDSVNVSDSVSEKHKLITWIAANANRVNKMKEPLTFDQCTKLKEDFHSDFIIEILLAMHNHEPLLRKNRNANLTFRNWADRDERYKKWRESKGIIQPNLNLK